MVEFKTSTLIFASQVGGVIGRGGETIRELQSRSGAKIQVCVSERNKSRLNMHRSRLTTCAINLLLNALL